MNPNDKQQTDFQNILVALNQYGEQQKDLRKMMDSLVTSQGQLLQKITGTEGKLADMKSVLAPVDTGLTVRYLQKKLEEINAKLPQQPVPVTRKLQILLFPEQDAKLFYKIVFGRWLLWLTILAGLYYGYKLAVQYIDYQKAIELRHEDNKHIQRAWLYLYNQSGKNYRKRMDSVLVKTTIELPSTIHQDLPK